MLEIIIFNNEFSTHQNSYTVCTENSKVNSLSSKFYSLPSHHSMGIRWTDLHVWTALVCKHPCQPFSHLHLGALWFSGRVLNSRPRVDRFKPHWHHCAVSLSKTH